MSCSSICDGVELICARQRDLRLLRIEVIRQLRRVFGFTSYAWLLTDPETWVGVDPLAEIPQLSDLPRVIGLKYLSHANRWTGLPADRALSMRSAEGPPERNMLDHELLRGYGVTDIASLVFTDAYGCWGFLDIWRAGGTFRGPELDLLSGLIRPLTGALRSGVAATFGPDDDRADPPEGAAVLMLSENLHLVSQTAQTDAYLRTLLPPEGPRSPVPAAAYNVAAQLIANEQGVDPHPAKSRVHLGGGAWLTLRAARIAAPGSGSIAVTIEATPPADRARLFARAHGLSERESQLLGLLLGGPDTRTLAGRMSLSEHTVQDHLKSIFAKTGTGTRATLVARAVGA